MRPRTTSATTLALIVALSGCVDRLPTSTSTSFDAPPLLSKGSGNPPTPPPATGVPSVTTIAVTPSIVAGGVAAGFVVGGTTATGTVTLSAAPASPTVVSLSSDNSFVMPVPSTVTVAAGQRSATFAVGSIPVTGTFTLNLSAGVSSITATSRVYVVPNAQTDIIQIPRLDLSPKRSSPPLGEVKVEATSTNRNAVLTAYYAGSPVATLTNNGGGRFSATFTIPTLDTDVEVRSQTGGCGVRATNRPTPSRSCPSL